jgi:hypothetical protein
MTTTRTYRHRVLSTSVAGLGLAVALALVPGTASAAEARATIDLKTHVARADSAMTQAIQRIQAQEYGQAGQALATATGHIRQANVQATALVGAPPTDPESDDPPGPPAVLTALRLDNRVSLRLTPLFDGTTRARLLDALRSTIRAAQVRRVAVLDRVLALPAEGDGADYADGLADTLPSYAREVAAFSQALDTFSLTVDGRSALTAGLHRAQKAEARMQSAYGGGERPVS